LLTTLSGQQRQPFLLPFFDPLKFSGMLRSKECDVAETLYKQAAFLPERL